MAMRRLSMQVRETKRRKRTGLRLTQMTAMCCSVRAERLHITAPFAKNYRTRSGAFPKTTVFPQSEWVQAESALLGVIYKEGIPQFLCVAVPAQGDPPAEMKEHGCFVPASPYSEEDGFWVVFQSADSGEYVTISDS